jgi:pimeloyl-ACP methyl ester carboxylesterase
MLAPLPTTTSLHLREEGSGPPLLLLHGTGGDHTVWNGVVRGLAGAHRVLAPDLRGHGRSPAPAGATYSFEELERDIEQLLTDRGLDSAHVVGLSGGGFLALRIAVDAPHRLRSLIVIGAAAQVDGHTRDVAESWAETYRTEGYEAYIRRLAMDSFSADWLESHLDFVDRLRDSMRSREMGPVLRWAEALRGFDLRSRVGRIQAPTLVVHGLEDRIVDPSHARYLRQAIRGAELRLFPNTGHLVPVERPEDTARAIREWVAQHEQTALPSSGASA